MRYRYLSHTIDDDMPRYGGRLSLEVIKKASSSDGSKAGDCRFTIGSHVGTHVDGPNHFFESGKKVFEYPPEFWIFKSPKVIEVSLEPSQTLSLDQLSGKLDGSCDLLLLKSGWTRSREQDIYFLDNPGIDPEVGLHLRRDHPGIRAVGIDWISLSAYKNRSLGRQAHKAFLDPSGGSDPILPIEDMDLSCDLRALKEVMVFPLRLSCADSATCTIVGGFDD